MPLKLSENPHDLAGYDAWATREDCHYDEAAGQLVVDFFAEMLTHVEGKVAGEQFELTPWEERFVRLLYGWKRPDGSRRYRVAYLEVPRGNGKTTLCSGLALFSLLCDGEQRGSVICVAGSVEQASLVFNTAADMVANNPILAGECKVGRHYRKMTVKRTSSEFKAVPSKPGPLHGLNPSAIYFDELHVQPSRELWDVMQTAKCKSSRRQPITVAITTAGVPDDLSICWEVHQHAAQVRDGVVTDPSFLPTIYTSDGEWDDEKTWAEANPNLDISVSRDYLREQAGRAQGSLSLQGSFRRLHLNQWTKSLEQFLDPSRWAACSNEDFRGLDGEICYGGLDLSSKTDLSAFVLCFPIDDKYVFRTWAFLPEGRLRDSTDPAPYREWAENGHLRLVPGDVLDLEYIHEEIGKLSQQYRLKEICFDPWNAEVSRQCIEREYGIPMIECRQTYGALSEATKELRKIVLSGQAEHDNNLVMNWCINNVSVSTDPCGNIRPVRPRDSARHKKIDCVVAAIMSLKRAMVRDGVYDSSCFVSV